MTTYKKKPVTIEAFQMTKDRRLNQTEWPDWLIEAHDKFDQEQWDNGNYLSNIIFPQQQRNSDGTDNFMVLTKNGLMKISWNDWIIKDTQGELYPCKPDIFEMLYEKISEDQKEIITKDHCKLCLKYGILCSKSYLNKGE